MHIQIPGRLVSLLDQALQAITDPSLRERLAPWARTVSSAVWGQYLARRPPQDNRVEHEFIVLGNVLRIAYAEQCDESALRVAIAFSFLHDSHFIPRITEWQIRACLAAAENTTDTEEAARQRARAEELTQARKTQRQRHMAGGVVNARRLLEQMAESNSGLLPTELECCLGIIARHDEWKLGIQYPETTDRLALACVEGDALWPLHPLGVLADLERPEENGSIQDVNDPRAWQVQVTESEKTLRIYRANWPADEPGFCDKRSIFRTQAGGELYQAWCRHWGLP